MKKQLKKHLKNAGAFDVGIASPFSGYEKAEKGYSPLEVWPSCKSVIVFAVAMTPYSNNTYIGSKAPNEGESPLGPVPRLLQSNEFAMNRLSRQITAPVTLTALAFLEHYNCITSLKTIQCKLSGYLAGLGVYGKSGLLIHPVLGNRMSLTAIMTNCELEHDKPLENFDPCKDCSICIDLCPAGAFDTDKTYPESWDWKKCTGKRREIEEKGFYCHNCFAACPAGTVPDELLIRKSKMTSVYSCTGVE